MTLRLEQYDDVIRLRMHSPGSRAVGLDVSAYLVRGVLVDTGFPHARRSLLAALRAHSVDGIAVTHWHEDHAGNVHALAALGLPMLMRTETEAMLRTRPSIALYRHLIWGRPPRVTSPITAFGPDGIRAIHTPGHSPDHQVLWDETTGTLFSGDLWLGVRARAMHASEDPYMILESLRRVRALEPARMFDAHRGLVESPIAALDARIEWLSGTLAEIEDRIGAGWSDREIVSRVLGGEERSGILSAGDYARRNLVRAVRRSFNAAELESSR